MPSPLEKYDDDNLSRWEVLKHVPEWETERLLKWVEGVVHEPGRDRWGNTVAEFNSSLLPMIQRKERIIFSEIGVEIDGWYGFRDSLDSLLSNNIEHFILVLETLVKYVRDEADSYGRIPFFSRSISNQDALSSLDNILSNGSKWRVVYAKKSRAGLQERTSEQLTEVAKSLSNKDLTDAWNLVFGRETDTKLAIEKAQNAIEYYATKAGLSKSTSNVFGVFLADVKANPTNYLSAAGVQFTEQDEAMGKPSPDGSLNDMFANWFWYGLNLIQKTNVVRHKTSDNNDYVIPLDAARQAVLMATLICEYIDKGYFIKKPKK